MSESLTSSKSLTNYLIELSKTYYPYFLALFVISIVASLLEISVHYKIKEIIDQITYKTEANLALLIGLFAGYKLLHHGMFFIVRLLDIRYKPGLATRTTIDIYNKTIKHSLHWFDNHLSGEIADKINSFQVSLASLITNKSKTVIAIAHRLSTLKHMDRIIVMDKGRIIEEGTHDELLSKPTSLYKKLWELQEI
jgi:ATP-binding cassette, subfamily B, bacterial